MNLYPTSWQLGSIKCPRRCGIYRDDYLVALKRALKEYNGSHTMEIRNGNELWFLANSDKSDFWSMYERIVEELEGPRKLRVEHRNLKEDSLNAKRKLIEFEIDNFNELYKD